MQREKNQMYSPSVPVEMFAKKDDNVTNLHEERRRNGALDKMTIYEERDLELEITVKCCCESDRGQNKGNNFT